MANTLDALVKAALGDQLMALLQLQAQLEQARERITALEVEITRSTSEAKEVKQESAR